MPTIVTKEVYQELVTTLLADNTSREISESIIREMFEKLLSRDRAVLNSEKFIFKENENNDSGLETGDIIVNRHEIGGGWYMDFRRFLGGDPEDSGNYTSAIKLEISNITNLQSTLDDKADITYVNSLVTGLWDDRGAYDASVNEFPSTGGSGDGGNILKGDIWTISVPGTLGATEVSEGWTVRALVDEPGVIAANWATQSSGLTYTPLNYDIDNYPSLSLPILPTDKFLVNRGAGWKKANWGDTIIPSVLKSYFVNSVTGNNATGVYQDPTKPFATIDYVFALPAFASGDVIWLQNENGIFPLNSQIPINKDITIYSDLKVTLDVSANNNTWLYTGNNVNTITFDLQKGIFKNDKSGGVGVKIEHDNANFIFKLKEMYLNCSNSLVSYSVGKTIFEAQKVSGRVANSFSSHINIVNEVLINEFVCLAVGASFGVTTTTGIYIIKKTILSISGPGSYYFHTGRYDIGNISTTGTSYSLSGTNLYLNFLNSVITSANGILLSQDLSNGVVISGHILSSNKIYTSSTGSGILKFINFIADLKIGTLQLYTAGSDIYFENCSIKSDNSPITLVTNPGSTPKLTIKNSSFEVVNAVPLTTGGTGSNWEVKISGLSTNATMISDQEGTGVTVTSETIQGNIKLPKYTSARNDGALPINKVLSVDGSGNLKLYSMPIMPPPYLEELIPDSYLPETTGNFLLKGSFFTPTTTVTVEGQTVNYITFISDNEIRVNATTGEDEGSFDVTIDNGISVTFPDALLIVLGEVFTPVDADYTVISGDVDTTEPGEVKVEVENVAGLVEFFNIPFGQDFRVNFRIAKSPLNSLEGTGLDTTKIQLCQSGTVLFSCLSYINYISTDNFFFFVQESSTGIGYGNPATNVFPPVLGKLFTYERIGTTFNFKVDNIIVKTFTDTVASGDLQIRIGTQFLDVVNIKYVELI